jgi:hypothetical protein
MNLPVVKPEISLGHLITVGTVIVSIALAWGNLDGRVTATEKTATQHDAAIRELSSQQDTMRDTLTEIRVDVGYLRRWVEEIKRDSQVAFRP